MYLINKVKNNREVVIRVLPLASPVDVRQTPPIVVLKRSTTFFRQSRYGSGWPTHADAIGSIGVSEVTYYRWRQEFGGLKSDQVKRLKDLETENTRLRRAVSDLTLDKLILPEAARGND